MNFEDLKLHCACGGSMKKMVTNWKGIDVKGWKCKKCSEELINPEDSQKALEIERARKKNELQVKIRKVGKSNVVTIPQTIMETEKLRSGQKVEWSIKSGKLVITP
jgi:septum formation inhibitor MinC